MLRTLIFGYCKVHTQFSDLIPRTHIRFIGIIPEWFPWQQLLNSKYEQEEGETTLIPLELLDI